MVVEGLLDRQLLQRALEERDRHPGVRAPQRLNAEIDLLLHYGVKVYDRGRDVKRRAGVRGEVCA